MYGDLQNAYLIEFGVDHFPLCEFCGERETKQICFDEFSSSCGHEECEIKRKTVVNIRLGQERVAKILGLVEQCQQELPTQICECCNEEFKPNLLTTGRTGDEIKFDQRRVCYRKTCSSILSQNPDIDFKKYNDGKRLILLALSGEDVSFELNDIKQFLKSRYSDPEVERFRRYLLTNNIYWNLEYKRLSFVTNYDYGDGFLYTTGNSCSANVCLNCGKFVSSKQNKIFEYIAAVPDAAQFCDRECYWEAKRTKKWIQPLTDEGRKKLSENMKNLIHIGVLTPCVTDTWTKRRWRYKGSPYRSSWELLFAIIQEFYGQTVHFEKLRIPYNDGKKDRIYLVDFVNEQTRIVYEIKPRELFDDLAKLKDESLLAWCEANNFVRELIDETYFTLSLSDDIIYEYVCSSCTELEDVDPVDFRKKFIDVWRK